MTEMNFKSVCDINQSKIGELELPDSTKRVLVFDGLPKTSALLVSFTAESGTFPTLDAYCRSNNLPQAEHGERFYRIGTDEGSQICLTKGDGQVVAIAPHANHPQRFVNSNLERFLELLELYQLYATSVQIASEVEADSMTHQTITKMRQTDPEAFSDPDSWWASVAQQMEFGML